MFPFFSAKAVSESSIETYQYTSHFLSSSKAVSFCLFAESCVPIIPFSIRLLDVIRARDDD